MIKLQEINLERINHRCFRIKYYYNIKPKIIVLLIDSLYNSIFSLKIIITNLEKCDK